MEENSVPVVVEKVQETQIDESVKSEAVKQKRNNFDWLKEYQWQKGQSGNPNGRPKEKTLKEYAREFLANMSEESRIAYFQGMKREEVWRMAEGNPATATDITTKGESLTPLLVKFIENGSNNGNTTGVQEAL